MTRRFAPFLLALTFVTACKPAAPASMVPTETGTSLPQATFTSSPVPSSVTPSETPAPAPRNFTEDFSANIPNWTFRQIDNGQPAASPATRDGFLVFGLGTPNQWAYALYDPQEYADVVVETQVQSRTAGDGAAGIVCRYDENRGWYEFNIYADQTYELLFGQWLATGVARYTPLYQGESENIQADTNEIGLSCQGNILTPVINGIQMRRWQEQKFALQKGKIGLSVSSFQDNPFTIAFDWVKVKVP